MQNRLFNDRDGVGIFIYMGFFNIRFGWSREIISYEVECTSADLIYDGFVIVIDDHTYIRDYSCLDVRIIK